MQAIRAVPHRVSERWAEYARMANIVICAAALIAATPYLTV